MATFAFIFGGGKDSFQDRLRNVLQSQNPPVTLLEQKKLNGVRIASLNEAIRFLTNPITQVDKLILGTHSGTSFVRMDMFRPQVDDENKHLDSTYEILQDTITKLDGTTPADANHTIKMPQAITGAPPPKCTVLVVGCNIGQGTPFMDLWNKRLSDNQGAAGDNVELIAPLHFDSFTPPITNLGMWESLEYEFQVFSPTKLERADMMAQFHDKGVKDNFVHFVDDTKVPDPYWLDPQWYLPAIDLEGTVVGTEMQLDVPISGTKRTGFQRGLETKRSKFQFWTVDYDAFADLPNPTTFNMKDKASKAAWVALCKESIKLQLPKMKSSNRFRSHLDPLGGSLFPEWERWGYADVATFVEGWDWEFTVLPAQKGFQFLLQCAGRRWVYTLSIPVADPNPTPAVKHIVGKVRTNFYPDPNFQGTLPSPIPHNLDTSKPTLFYTAQ